MRKTSLMFIASLAAMTATSTVSAAEDYAISLMNGNSHLLEIEARYQASISRLQSQGEPFNYGLMTCTISQSAFILPIMLSLQNASSLSLSTSIAGSPDERAQVRSMLQLALAVARDSTASTISLFRTFEASPVCRDEELSRLNRSAVAVLTDIGDVLGRLPDRSR